MNAVEQLDRLVSGMGSNGVRPLAPAINEIQNVVSSGPKKLSKPKLRGIGTIYRIGKCASANPIFLRLIQNYSILDSPCQPKYLQTFGKKEVDR